MLAIHPNARTTPAVARSSAGRWGSPSSVTAVDNVLSLINLSLLTGHVGRWGSGLNPLRGQNNVQGGGDMGAIPNKLPGFQDVQDDMEARARYEAAWDVKLPPERGWHLSQMFDGHGARRVQHALRPRREPRAVGGRLKARTGAARGPRLHDRPGHPHDQDVRDGRCRVSRRRRRGASPKAGP